MKKALIIFMLVMVLGGCATSSGKGGSGQRDNASDLEPSPCAGCFGEEEKDRMNIEDLHVS